jgi:hypothetical protein
MRTFLKTLINTYDKRIKRENKLSSKVKKFFEIHANPKKIHVESDERIILEDIQFRKRKNIFINHTQKIIDTINNLEKLTLSQKSQLMYLQDFELIMIIKKFDKIIPSVVKDDLFKDYTIINNYILSLISLM